MIEQAYTLGASLGVAVWTQDEAGPFQCKPVAGQQWHEPGQPRRRGPQTYLWGERAGTDSSQSAAESPARAGGDGDMVLAVATTRLTQEGSTALWPPQYLYDLDGVA